jgi:hypothetical protein
LNPTDIKRPDYFHKVVDCQWACPAHTQVPEYIRLIAAGRYGDAYLVNWRSNVFPGILGRTCDRPCEPACRRARVEEGSPEHRRNAAKPEPVAICRLKRVAADYKDDIRPRLPQRASARNGKRVALIGAGPASLTVARDLAPLGYECVVFDADALAGGMMRTQIPKFRLPDRVIDEEVGYVLDLGVEFRPGDASIDGDEGAASASGYDADRSSAAGRRADATSTFPGAREAAANMHIGIDWLASVSFGHTTRIGTARRRAGRRQHGDGLLPQLEEARRGGCPGRGALGFRRNEGVAVGEGGRAARRHSDPQLPRAAGFRTRRRHADRRAFREGPSSARRARAAGSSSRPVNRPVDFACDDVLVAIGQENAFPWIERDLEVAFDDRGMPVVDRQHDGVDAPRGVLRRRRRVRAEEHHLGGRATATRRRSRSTSPAAASTLSKRPPPHVNLVSQKMGIHEWSYDNAIHADRRYRVPLREVTRPR